MFPNEARSSVWHILHSLLCLAHLPRVISMLSSEASLHTVARFLFSLLCVDTIALQTVLRAQSALGFTVDTLCQMFLSWFFDADMITLIHTPAAPGMNPICRWLSTQCELGNGAAMFANMMTAALTHVDVERALLLATFWRGTCNSLADGGGSCDVLDNQSLLAMMRRLKNLHCDPPSRPCARHSCCGPCASRVASRRLWQHWTGFNTDAAFSDS